MSQSSVTDRVIIVTGGAKGIGRAYCEHLATAGARVVVADIDGEGARAVAETLTRQGSRALAVAVDVSDPESTAGMARAAVAAGGRIDGLVNNAGMFQRPAVSVVPFEEIPLDEWDRVMAVNLRGVFLCCRAVAPYMKEQRHGKIVNVASDTIYRGYARLSHYVASKAGVVGFTRSIARELGEFNIHVNAVAPGYTMSLGEDAPSEAREQARRWAGKLARMGCIQRVQEPADLVRTVAFLLSPDSDFITGQTIVVDGGIEMV